MRVYPEHPHVHVKTKGMASLLAWMFVLVLLVLVIWEEAPRSPINAAERWDFSQPDQYRYTHSHALHSCLHTHVLYTRLQLLVPQLQFSLWCPHMLHTRHTWFQVTRRGQKMMDRWGSGDNKSRASFSSVFVWKKGKNKVKKKEKKFPSPLLCTLTLRSICDVSWAESQHQGTAGMVPVCTWKKTL